MNTQMTFWDWLTANPDTLGQGAGLFCPLHFALMFLMAAVIAGFVFIFRRCPAFARHFAFGMGIFMIVSRLFRMIFRTVTLWHGGITIIEEIIPWHICHIMCFFVGFALILDNSNKRHGRKNKLYITAISYYGFVGSVLTFMFGDYYRFAVLSFYDIESILLHICLCLGWLYFLMQHRYEFSYSAIFGIFIGMFLLLGYGAIGNLLLAPTNPQINNMFIRFNGLPFSLFPNANFLFTYTVLAVIVYGTAVVWLAIKRRRRHSPQPHKAE